MIGGNLVTAATRKFIRTSTQGGDSSARVLRALGREWVKGCGNTWVRGEEQERLQPDSPPPLPPKAEFFSLLASLSH